MTGCRWPVAMLLMLAVTAVDVAARKVIANIPVGEAPKRNGTVMIP